MAPIAVPDVSKFGVDEEQSLGIEENVKRVISSILPTSEYLQLCGGKCTDDQITNYLHYRVESTRVAQELIVRLSQAIVVPAETRDPGVTDGLSEPSPGSSVSQESDFVYENEPPVSPAPSTLSQVGSWKPSRRVKDGYCYAKVINCHSYKNVIGSLGTWPTVRKLLMLPASYFEPDSVLKRFTIRPSFGDRFHVSAGGQGSPLLAEFTYVAHKSTFAEESYGRMLQLRQKPPSVFEPLLALHSQLGGSEFVGDVQNHSWHDVYRAAGLKRSVRTAADIRARNPISVDDSWGVCVMTKYSVLFEKLRNLLERFPGLEGSPICVAFLNAETVFMDPLPGSSDLQQVEYAMVSMQVVDDLASAYGFTMSATDHVNVLRMLLTKDTDAVSSTNTSMVSMVKGLCSIVKTAVLGNPIGRVRVPVSADESLSQRPTQVFNSHVAVGTLYDELSVNDVRRYGGFRALR